MKKISVLFVLLLVMYGCSGKDVSSSSDDGYAEKINESKSYILCVEVDEADSEDNEALKEPRGDYISIMTSPLNAEKSMYRFNVNKERFRFFCSPLSEWSFEKVSLTRANQYKLRWAFHHKPDGADLLITSTWFLTQKSPQTNAKDLNIVNSDIFSEQVHRLRILEQASFCLQDGLVMNDAQSNICSGVLDDYAYNYLDKKNQVLRDARVMQRRNTGN